VLLAKRNAPRTLVIDALRFANTSYNPAFKAQILQT
jgi:hypothetical protein